MLLSVHGCRLSSPLFGSYVMVSGWPHISLHSSDGTAARYPHQETIFIVVAAPEGSPGARHCLTCLLHSRCPLHRLGNWSSIQVKELIQDHTSRKVSIPDFTPKTTSRDCPNWALTHQRVQPHHIFPPLLMLCLALFYRTPVCTASVSTLSIPQRPSPLFHCPNHPSPKESFIPLSFFIWTISFGTSLCIILLFKGFLA